jgi:transglutaminase-like putative cysteine protease
MQLCDFCGFVIGQNDNQCKNCSSQVAGRQIIKEAHNVRALSPKPITEKIIYTPPRKLGHYIPRKTLALLLVIGLVMAPQTQTLIKDGSEYWDELNTPYYNIPQTLELTLIRNFTIYLPGESGFSDYKLILSKPDNRPSGPQQDSSTWQEVHSVSVYPNYLENEAGRMEWNGTISDKERHYIEVEYKVSVNTLRPDLTPDESGTLDDIPAGYEAYLDDEWLIEPSLPVISELASEMVNDTEGNVIQILQNIFDYIMNGYTYEKSSIPKSCPESIEQGYGDCDDFSILFASIARAAGIPTWLELGKIPAFVDSQNGKCDLKDWGGHAWINAIVPLSDGTITTVNIDIANSYFMWMPAYRISDWVDDGNGDNLYSYYYLFSSQGTAKANYLENTYVSDCELTGNLKLEEL